MIIEREAARILYDSGTNQKDIARIVKRSEKTISAWKREDNWERKRTESILAKQTAEETVWELINYQLTAIKFKKDQWEKAAANGEEPKLIDKGDIDALQKLFTTVKTKELEWSTIVKVLREFIAWLRTEDLALAQDLVDPVDNYLNYKRQTCNMAGLSAKDKKEYQEWLKEKESVARDLPVERETPKQKEVRIKRLKENFYEFCRYYFGHMMDSEFGWFHKKAAREIIKNDDLFLILEWPREHAKSIFADVFVPLHLKAKGELTGMMVASANEKKASGLLADIQAELMFNKRYINDFGEQYSLGNWKDGHFVTSDGIGFWAFGRGQSPRGTRKNEKRPNYCVVDDIDDAVIVKNEARVLEAVDWVLGDLYGAMPNKGSRLVIAGNRIHKKSILAHLVGDVEPDDPKREDIVHIKVFALENPKTHKKDLSENGKPAWKERYERDDIIKKMNRQGWRIGKREFFHEHIIIGRVFKEEHLPWAKLPALSKYERLVTYNDPSYKGTKKNDYKAIVLLGKTGRYVDIIKVFCRQCNTGEMVRGHYNLSDLVPSNKVCKHYMEANFIQDLMLEEYYREGDDRGYYLAIRGDKRKKPDKEARIENLSPFAEKQLLRFNIEEKQNPDMQELRNQFLGFPDAEHDDGPDAVEGGYHKLAGKPKKGKGSGTTRAGKYRQNSRRRA